MSKYTAYDRVCCTVSASLAFTVALHFSSVAAQAPSDAPNLELVRSLKSAVDAIESLPAFDVAGLTIYREDFGDGKQPVVETFRFRMQVAHDRKVLRHVAESRTNRPTVHAKVGEPRYSSVLINGGTVQRNSLFMADWRNVSIVEDFQSFDVAITSGDAPAPGYWGLYRFPSSGLQNLYTWIEQISGGNATVTATSGDGTIRYVAQIDHDPGVRFDILHWEFKLPKYLPTFSKVERAIRDGRVETYREQNVDYTVVDGHEVPNVIRSWSPRIKREPQGFRIGKTHRVTELKWLRIANDAIDASPKHLTTLEQTRPFLDEGTTTMPLDLDLQ